MKAESKFEISFSFTFILDIFLFNMHFYKKWAILTPFLEVGNHMYKCCLLHVQLTVTLLSKQMHENPIGDIVYRVTELLSTLQLDFQFVLQFVFQFVD